MYKCIIIDDEEPARLLLQDYCNKTNWLQVTGMYKSPLECIDKVELEADILFLDINMPDISGIDFLKLLSHKPHVILTTAYRDYAITGFDLEVVDYLLKPIAFPRFLQAVNRIKNLKTEQQVSNNTNTEENNLHFVKSEKKIYRLKHHEIISIKSLNEYLLYNTLQHGNLIVYGTMKDVEKSLPSNRFCRIHRSYIVNLNHIEYTEGNQVYIAGAYLPISDGYKLEFNKQWEGKL